MKRFLSLLLLLPLYAAAKSDNNSDSGNDPVVFWSVNAFLITLLLSICSWFWCCGGEKFLNRTSSDDLYRQRVTERNLQRARRRTMTAPERKKTLESSFLKHKVRMTVREEDLMEESQANIHGDDFAAAPEFKEFDLEKQTTAETEPQTDFLDIEAAQHSQDQLAATDDDLSLGDELSTAGRGSLVLRQDECVVRRVPNLCAVCLMGYEPEEVVVWSSNPSCPHAFHEDCLLDWLVHSTQAKATITIEEDNDKPPQDDQPTCPCCRQSFARDLISFRKERKIRWGAENSFNPAVLRL